MKEQNIWENRMDTLSQFDYVIIDNFLPQEVLSNLKTFFTEKEIQDKLDKAAIGATGESKVINEIRGDYTFWLSKDRDGDNLQLFEVLDEVKFMINRFCFLSLSDYEFHLALYPVGSFYKKHLDQFKGRNNRMISMVIYLNENWKDGDGGELKIYPFDKGEKLIEPLENRCILFRSDVLYHEVLPTKKPRKSVTGWMLYQPSPLVTIAPK
jgi:SM-20-related protein